MAAPVRCLPDLLMAASSIDEPAIRLPIASCAALTNFRPWAAADRTLWRGFRGT
jgi:hypothetical protein